MIEFKLQYYFELYKDTPVLNTARFKKEFTEKHGNFDLIYELIIMIQRYQHKKYGDLISYGDNTIERNCNRGRNEMRRRTERFGNRRERERRKIIERWSKWERLMI